MNLVRYSSIKGQTVLFGSVDGCVFGINIRVMSFACWIIAKVGVLIRHINALVIKRKKE